MQISYKWLNELTGLDWSAQEMGDRLTLCGTACEYIEPTDAYMDKVVVGEVKDLKPIEGASKIQLATVDIGSETMDLVCGAPNVAVGQKVPVALIGARLAGDIVIKKAKIRGVESRGMICSERELGISDEHAGIMVLPQAAEIGAPVAQQLDMVDAKMIFEITPNRGDSMSAIGIARDLAALASIKVRTPEIELDEKAEKAADYVSVAIDDPHACPRYAARVIRHVNIGPSPWWLKKKLLTAGVRPISNVVDITNLVMLETGHPLHAFDLDRFGSSEVVVRRATAGELFTTLDGTKHELTPQVLLITNGKTGVAAGGVMGGLDSEVEDDTTNILLEAAYFNPAVIRRSRKELGVVSESSSRFEKGADPNGVEYAINRAASLMQQLCGGEVLAGIVDCYPKKIEPAKISLRPARCNAVLGTNIAAERMKQILADLQFDVTGGDPIEVTVPTFRLDISAEIDLIEEIVRIEGYESVPDAIANLGPLSTPLDPLERFKTEVRRILTGSGYDEIISHGLAHSQLASVLYPETPQVKIINPVSEELDIMRTSLIQTALTVISHNVAHRNLDLRLFEIGLVYFPASGTDERREENRLTLAMTGNTPHTWRDRPRPHDFYDISGAINRLAEHFKWGKVEYRPADVRFFDSGISFDIYIAGQAAGRIGRVTQKVARRFDIKETVLVAELSLEPLISRSDGLSAYQPLPIYPAAPRDLAIVVDESVRAGEIINAVKEAGGTIAESVDLFDLYTGKQIEKGKKSLAVSISYRSQAGNLESAQIAEAQANVVSVLKQQFNAEIRDK